MHKRQSKFEFLALVSFLAVGTLLLTNGFVARIFAQGTEVDVFEKIKPIGDVINTIMDEYVKEPDIDKVVEGSLVGMMNSLDKHSSYVSAEMLRELREDTKGEFFGIGVQIQFDDDKNIVVRPLPESPARDAGIMDADVIVKIDGVSAAGISLDEAKRRIRGPQDSVVVLTVFRRHEKKDPEILDVKIKRGTIPMDSVKEARLLDKGIGYIRISDFKDNTTRDLAKNIHELRKQGMSSLILDLRWNPGGLLTASRQACELFLPKNTLVTYTKGRKTGHNSSTENLRLYTEKSPILPEGVPVIILINEDTASSAEIVTGAMQYWSRAIVVGQKTYGKGSVQTIIPLARPVGSALRLTTALYYTPAEVTIDGEGIKPDVEVTMNREQQLALFKQMYKSLRDDPSRLNEQNHGSATGNEVDETSVEDVQLKQSIEILQEDSVFEHLLTKYHKDTHETQVAAAPEKALQDEQSDDAPSMSLEDEAPIPETAPEEKAPAN